METRGPLRLAAGWRFTVGSASYSANLLNQYTNRTVPGFLNILGQARTNATVTLWSADSLSAVTPTYRKGEYFRGELPLNNSSGAVWLTITNLAVLNNGTNADILSTNIGRSFVPRTPEAFAHDADGNLTNDARWTYTWDAENRLTSFTRPGTAPDAAKVKVDCQYDGRGRRTQKVVSSWNGSAYVAQSTNRFLYDGWNLVGIFDAQSSLLQSFTWGTDLSGTMQGAGGVGGLKSMTVHSGSLAGTYFYCYDGNGNVAALVAAADGSLAAQYEYGPFGEVVRATGPLAQANPFLFSTKFCDAETGFYYYGYRYYAPSTGRWPSRDPIQEKGFASVAEKKRLLLNPRVDYKNLNIFASFLNNPIGIIDPLGLGTWHVDFQNNGTPEAVIDVYYVFSDGELGLGCCTAATVDRYLVDIIMVSTRPDQDEGGSWDAVNKTAHAEFDAPQGVTVRWPYAILDGVYHLAGR